MICHTNRLQKCDYLYLFYGYGIEYVLKPIAEYMKADGYNVLEMDLCLIDNPAIILQGVKDKNIVFITSWHLWLDSKNLEMYFTKIDIWSPLEVMNYLKPVKSVFYPHDLGCTIHRSEIQWIDLFDVVLWPMQDNNYYLIKQRCKNIAEVGWIKKTKNVQHELSEECKVVYLPSNIARMLGQRKEKAFVENISRYLSTSIDIKLFQWSMLEELYKELHSHGYTVLEDKITAFELMEQYDLIIGNGLSSVIYEAAYSGFPVISLLDDVIASESVFKEMKRFEWVYPMKIEEVDGFIKSVKEGTKILQRGKEILRTFDFEQVTRLIGADYE